MSGPETSGWGAGYVTDVAYMPGYYPHQSPRHLSVACLLGGVAGLEPRRMQHLSYLELGCGQGYGALVQAVSNPDWQVTAVDFNPAHIAAARDVAAEAEVRNITFIEADLATLTPEALPEADVVSLHGVWSWVPPPVRAGIVRLIGARLRPGGIAHVSYNALPAWQGAIGMQRVLREAGSRLAGRSDRQAQAGMQTLQALAAAEARHLKGSSFAAAMVAQLGALPSPYLAHEYMNASWSPCFHADVVAALAPAKLEWVASAQMIENFPELALTGPQREVMHGFDDPAMRELVKDMCLERALRQDVFVRGARRLDAAARDAALREVVLALRRPARDFVYAATVPAGDAKLEPSFYGPIVAALARGPQRVADLLELPDVAGHSDNPAELVGMLLGTDQALVVAPGAVAPAGAAVHPSVARFNDIATRLLVSSQNMLMSVAVASDRLGTGMPCQILELYLAARMQQPGAEVALDRWTQELAGGRDSAEQDKLRGFLSQMSEHRLSHWRRLGIVPEARR
jgi:SAM-dependent methyltransferase